MTFPVSNDPRVEGVMPLRDVGPFGALFQEPEQEEEDNDQDE